MRRSSVRRMALAGTWIVDPCAEQQPEHMGLALGYVQASARAHLQGIDITRHDFPLPLGGSTLPAGALDALLAGDPEVVGISSYCWDRDAFARLVGEVERRCPATRIILGGPTATYDGEGFMREVRGVDVAVRGEGETAIVELLTGGLDDPSAIPGLVYRDGDDLRETPPRPPIPDLAQVASPYLSGVMRPPHQQLLLSCSRGCVFRCRYCGWKGLSGAMRYADPDLLRRELRWAVEHDYRHAFIIDSSINFDTDRLADTTGAIAGAVPHGDMSFTYFLSHQHFEPKQLGPLSKLAPHQIWIGLESFQPAALHAIGRPAVQPARFASFLDEVSVLGPANVSIIVGLPGDDLAGFIQTVDTLAALAQDGPRRRIADIRVFWMLVAPGTSVAKRAGELGIRTIPGGMPYLLGSRSFPREDMARAFRFLFTHPQRELFTWGDIPPAPHFEGREIPDPLAPSTRGARLPARPGEEARDHAGPGGPRRAAQGAEPQPGRPFGGGSGDATPLLPRLVADTPLVDGWRVERWSVVQGWPTLAVTKRQRRVDIQFRQHAEGQPCYCSAGRFDILWLTDSPGQTLDADAERVLRHVVREVCSGEPRA